MTGKHYQWHRAWSRLPSGRLKHISGLEFEITHGDGYTDVVLEQSTMDEFQRHERARGVPVHDLVRRLQRLCHEANDWIRYQQEQGK